MNYDVTKWFFQSNMAYLVNVYWLLCQFSLTPCETRNADLDLAGQGHMTVFIFLEAENSPVPDVLKWLIWRAGHQNLCM